MKTLKESLSNKPRHLANVQINEAMDSFNNYPWMVRFLGMKEMSNSAKEAVKNLFAQYYQSSFYMSESEYTVIKNLRDYLVETIKTNVKAVSSKPFKMLAREMETLNRICSEKMNVSVNGLKVFRTFPDFVYWFRASFFNGLMNFQSTTATIARAIINDNNVTYEVDFEFDANVDDIVKVKSFLVKEEVIARGEVRTKLVEKPSGKSKFTITYIMTW